MNTAKSTLIAVCLIGLVHPSLSIAQEYSTPIPAIKGQPIAPFTLREPTTHDYQKLPLLEVKEKIVISKQAKTVKQGIEEILSGTGYTLSLLPTPFYDKPIADVQRKMNDVMIFDALYTLSGPAFNVLFDPITRKVGFRSKINHPEPEIDPTALTSSGMNGTRKRIVLNPDQFED